MRKAVYAWDTGGSQWESTPMLDERYVYDGWNVVLVLDGNASNAVTRQYTWGLDLSGLGGTGVAPGVSPVSGIHGAGGIGGLLAVVETQGTATTADDEHFWFLYDGNGNVGQLLRYAAQANPPVTLAAHYAYDPYGQTLSVHDADSSGYAAANPLRFSTKWFDAETGLGYWGYRYYTPGLGRWVSRDPIEEEGGINLYGFLQNTTTSIDPIGLKCCRNECDRWSLRVIYMAAAASKAGALAVRAELRAHIDCRMDKHYASYYAIKPRPLAVRPEELRSDPW